MSDPLLFHVIADRKALAARIAEALAQGGMASRPAAMDDGPLFVACEESPALDVAGLAARCGAPLVVVCDPAREAAGVAAMRAGAADYLLADNLARLVPVAERWLAGRAGSLERGSRVREGRFRDLVDNTPDAVVFFAVQSRRRLVLEDLNAAGERLLGRSRLDLVGRTADELLPEAARRTIDHCLGTGQAVFAEQAWPVGGARRWMHCTLVPTIPPGHPVQRLTAIWRDITDRKAFEQAIAEREEMFRRLVETTRMVPWEADISPRRFTYVGPQGAARFGYRHPQWYEPGFWERSIHPEDRERAKRECDEKAKDSTDYEIEYRMLSASGEVAWIRDLVSVFVNPDGKPMLHGFLIDVTARRQAEDEVYRLNAGLEAMVKERTEQLEAANRELEAFSYSVSHDLRAPLRAIDGFSKALLEDCGDRLDADGKDWLRRVRAASQRMGELIDDLLKLSRVSRGGLRHERVPMSELSQQVAASLCRQHPGRSVEWAIEPGLEAEGDPALLRVVLENLLGNAFKYTGRKTAAHISFGREGEAFAVRDDGAGFDPVYAGKLFQPFQRLHRPDEFEGHGIGLATVRRIVQRHGGRIWAEAEPGRGAAFFFTLERQVAHG